MTPISTRKTDKDSYKQATPADIDILFDVCWILSPTQIQKLISQYHVAEYEVSVIRSAHELRIFAKRSVGPERRRSRRRS